MIEEDTQAMLKCFDETGMNEDMQGGTKRLLVILVDTEKQQREHTLAMLLLYCYLPQGFVSLRSLY